MTIMRLLAGAVLTTALALPMPVPAAAAAPQVLHRGNMSEPDTLDPNKATGSWENNILGDLFLGLMTEDAKAEPIHGAAEAHTVSADGLTWTFTIREGHVWSDGTPVTADDFVFSFRRALDPALASEYASILYVLANAEAVNTGKAAPETLGVQAIDARTLELRLAFPAPYLPQLLMHTTFLPVPAHLVRAKGMDWSAPGTMVSNGAYQLAEWVPNGHVRIVRNPLFYDAANVAIDEVYFYPTDDADAAVKRFRAGELDINNGIPSPLLAFLQREVPEAVRIAPFLNTRYLAFNTQRAPFDDVRVRAALSMAIDRETITEKILRAGELPAYALVPPGMAGYPGTPHLRFRGQPLAERQAEARRLLAEAGFGPDNPLRFRFNYIGEPDSRRVAVALAGFWKDVGVIADTVVSEKKVHYDLLRVGDFDAGEANWNADFNDAKNYLFLAQPSSGAMNIPKYANMAFEEKVAVSDRELDAGRRQMLMAEAEQFMLDEHPLAPLYHGVSRVLVQPYVKGWEDNVTNVHRTRFLRLERPAAP